MDRSAPAIPEHLELDMPRVSEIFLHVDGVVAERGAGFRRRLAHQAFELVFFRNDLHAAPTAAGGSLDQDRIADLARELLRLGDAGERTRRARDEWKTELRRGPLGFDLVAHGPDVLGLRPHP